MDHRKKIVEIMEIRHLKMTKRANQKGLVDIVENKKKSCLSKKKW
jgi:hypothetical protein